MLGIKTLRQMGQHINTPDGLASGPLVHQMMLAAMTGDRGGGGLLLLLLLMTVLLLLLLMMMMTATKMMAMMTRGPNGRKPFWDILS